MLVVGVVGWPKEMVQKGPTEESAKDFRFTTPALRWLGLAWLGLAWLSYPYVPAHHNVQRRKGPMRVGVALLEGATKGLPMVSCYQEGSRGRGMGQLCDIGSGLLLSTKPLTHVCLSRHTLPCKCPIH